MKIKSFLAGGALVLASIVVAFVASVLLLGQSAPSVVVESQGVTRFGALHLTEAGGTATPVLRANQTGTGKVVEFLDGGTPVWSLNDGGAIEQTGGLDLNGQELTLDADADTSITADTDDQVDLEIGGGDVFVFKEFGATTIETTTTTRLLEILDSTPIMSDATNSMIGLNIDLGIGNSTGGTNSVYGVLVDGIEADADNTEIAIGLGSGWDTGFDAGTNTVINIGNAGTDFGSDGSLTTADTITITTGGLDVQAGGVSVTAGGITLSDGDTTLADDLIITAQTAISVADGAVITPTGTYQQLSSGAEITPTVTTTGVTAGTLLVLINTTDTTINLADSGTMMLTAAAALGQYDSLTLWFDGTNWIEVSRADN